MTPEQITKLNDWANLQSKLETMKADELRLRNELVAELFDSSKDEGTEHLSLNAGYKLTAVKKLHYSAKADNVLMDKLEESFHKLGVAGQKMFEQLFRFKPEVCVTPYKATLPVFLDTLKTGQRQTIQKALLEVVTVSPATPTLKLIAPGVK